MRKVIDVRPLSGRKVSVVFEDGAAGMFDVTPYMKTDFFKQLEDESYFQQVRLFFTGIGWPNGQDFGPDTIAADLQLADVVAEATENYK